MCTAVAFFTMAYRRYKRRYRRFKRRYRRRFLRGRRRGYKKRLNQSTTYKFSRLAISPEPIVTSANSQASGAWTFQLSDVPSATDFQSLFEHYMITGVKVYIIPRTTENTATNVSFGDFYYNVDYDDDQDPGIADMLEKQGTKIKCSIGRKFSVFIRPRARINMYNGVTGGTPNTPASMIAKPGVWLRTADANVPHYGFKWGWQGASVAVTLDTWIRYYIKVRGAK